MRMSSASGSMTINGPAARSGAGGTSMMDGELRMHGLPSVIYLYHESKKGHWVARYDRARYDDIRLPKDLYRERSNTGHWKKEKSLAQIIRESVMQYLAAPEVAEPRTEGPRLLMIGRTTRSG